MPRVRQHFTARHGRRTTAALERRQCTVEPVRRLAVVLLFPNPDEYMSRYRPTAGRTHVHTQTLGHRVPWLPREPEAPSAASRGLRAHAAGLRQLCAPLRPSGASCNQIRKRQRPRERANKQARQRNQETGCARARSRAPVIKRVACQCRERGRGRGREREGDHAVLCNPSR